MKKIFEKLLWILRGLLAFPTYLIVCVILAVIVGLITQDVLYGFLTILGIIGLMTIYVFLREIYKVIRDLINRKKKNENLNT